MYQPAIVIALIALTTACTATANDRPKPNTRAQTATQAETAKITALYQGWRDAVEASDVDAYVARLHPDVRMLPPNAPPLDGAGNYANFLRTVFTNATYDIEVVQPPVIDIVGNTAVVHYVYTITIDLDDAGVGITEPGALTASSTTARYIDVLLRDDHGTWSVWRHGWQAFTL